MKHDPKIGAVNIDSILRCRFFVPCATNEKISGAENKHD